jgi:protein phosphatase
MGGAAAGEVASEMAVLSVCRSLKEMPFGLSINEQLIEATERANREIWDRSRIDGTLAGMGTTLTAVLVRNHSAHISQVGDSRAYLVRGDEIYQLTRDQSFVQALLDAGAITEEQAARYPSNILMQALGTEPYVEPVITETEIDRGDYLFLCSDGLSNKVADEEIRHAIQTSINLTSACERLVEMANQRGGEDNITIIIARFDIAETIF